MINKPFDQISIPDLEQLIQNRVTESRTIEYKQDLPGKKDSDVKEFLADVSSFANSSGGDLIYGVETRGGVPTKINGLSIDFDKEILRMENIIRDGIEPRIKILLKQVGAAILMRITRSWIAPHRIIFQKWDKFYGRNSNGKYSLDTMELRAAFNLSGTLIDKIRHFRTERIMAIYSEDFPVPFYKGAKIVLHLIPLAAFDPNSLVDVITLEAGKVHPIYSGSYSCRINLEGYLAFSGGQNNQSHGYTQIYRNGIIEAVDALLLDHPQKTIPSIKYEEEIIDKTRSYLNVLNELGAAPPIIVFLTMVGVKGYRMGLQSYSGQDYPIDKDIVELPEVYIEDFSSSVSSSLKPLFDMVWNACGFQHSYNYDDAGEWKH